MKSSSFFLVIAGGKSPKDSIALLLRFFPVTFTYTSSFKVLEGSGKAGCFSN